MNPHPDNPADPDPGAPVDLLRFQEEEPGPGFLFGVRRRIHRRAVTAQLASYSWQMPKAVLIEMASVFGHVVRAIASNKDPRR